MTIAREVAWMNDRDNGGPEPFDFRPPWFCGPVVGTLGIENMSIRVADSVMPPTARNGNPAYRRRGEVVRSVILALVRTRQDVPLDDVMNVLKLSRSRVINHLGALVRAGRIRGYTTASGVVRVW